MPKLLQVEKALQAVKHGLIVGRWKPGDMLSIKALAQELGISNTPVRDAFNELVTQGVLEQRLGVGTSVPEHTLQEVADLWDVRGLLEAQAARWLAERGSEVALAALMAEAKEADEFITSAYEQLPRITNGAQYEDLRYHLYEAEDQFHRHFVEYAGSASLLVAWQPCHFLLLAAWVGLSASGLYRNLVKRHPNRWVMEAVSSRDPHLAEKAAREHIQHGKETLLGFLSGESDQ